MLNQNTWLSRQIAKSEINRYSDSVANPNRVKVTGKALDKEFVMTKAGGFEVIKLETIVEGSSSLINRVTKGYAESIRLTKIKIIIDDGGVMGFLRDILYMEPSNLN